MPIVPALIGLFAISEALVMIEEKMIVTEEGRAKAASAQWAGIIDGLRLSVKHWWQIVWTAFVGLFIGIVPGAGASIASFVAYQQSRLWSKHPELYGTGIPEGVIAPESANNGVTSGTLVPTLALGVPGGSTAAVMMIVLQYHGLVMGPRRLPPTPRSHTACSSRWRLAFLVRQVALSACRCRAADLTSSCRLDRGPVRTLRRGDRVQPGPRCSRAAIDRYR